MIRAADPQVVEEVKWCKPSHAMRGVPMWSHGGIVCTGETCKDKVKLTFAKRASSADPGRLFSASLDRGTRRAIDIREGDAELDAGDFKALLQNAVAFKSAQEKKLRK